MSDVKQAFGTGLVLTIAGLMLWMSGRREAYNPIYSDFEKGKIRCEKTIDGDDILTWHFHYGQTYHMDRHGWCQGNK